MKNQIKLCSAIVLMLVITASCNNSPKAVESNPNTSEEKEEVVFDIEKEKEALQKSFNGVMQALANEDAKAIAGYYTKDGVFMPNNGPVSTGRAEIEKAFEAFIESGFTDLDVESTWVEGCGDYLLDTEKWTLSNGTDTLFGKSLVIWKKEDGMWKMYKDMINTDN